MNEWKEYKLGEAPILIIDGDRGKNYPKQNEFQNSGYCLFLSTKNVRLTGFDFTDCQFITKERDEILRKGKLNRNDLVLTTRGTVGNIGFYSTSVHFENVRINSGMVIIRPFNELLDPLYNFYVFRFLQKDFLIYTSGSAQPQLPIRDLNEITISLPPLSEQKAIANVLSSLDDKIDLLHRQNATLEKMAETLFRQWFVEEAKEDWEEKKLGDIISIGSGKGLKKEQIIENGLYPILGANGEIGRTNEYLLDGKFIYTGRVGTIGNIFRIENEKVWLSDNTLIINPLEYFNFVYLLLKTSSLESYNVGSTQPLIRQSDVKEIEFVLPPKEKLLEFESIIDNVFYKIKFNQNQINKLTQLRETLLPKLMSGEVRVEIGGEE